MKAYTDLEQSKKLAEILPIESADMRYTPFNDTHPWVWDEEVKLLEKGSVPCWSLAALLDVIPNSSLHNTFTGWRCDSYNEFTPELGETKSNPIDTCFEMILKIYEQKFL